MALSWLAPAEPTGLWTIRPRTMSHIWRKMSGRERVCDLRDGVDTGTGWRRGEWIGEKGMAGWRRGVVSGRRAATYWMTAPRSHPREPESLLPLHGGYRHLKSMSYPRGRRERGPCADRGGVRFAGPADRGLGGGLRAGGRIHGAALPRAVGQKVRGRAVEKAWIACEQAPTYDRLLPDRL